MSSSFKSTRFGCRKGSFSLTWLCKEQAHVWQLLHYKLLCPEAPDKNNNCNCSWENPFKFLDSSQFKLLQVIFSYRHLHPCIDLADHWDVCLSLGPGQATVHLTAYYTHISSLCTPLLLQCDSVTISKLLRSIIGNNKLIITYYRPSNNW